MPHKHTKAAFALLTQELEYILTKAKNTFFVGAFTALSLGSTMMVPAAASPASKAEIKGSNTKAKANGQLVPDAAAKAEPLHGSANLSYKVAGKRYYPNKKVENFSQTGKASWYGPGFHGRKTSNGERFDMHTMTAAHRTLPIPSYARVTNLSNGKSVVVRINDRGPFHGNRVVDVSKAAAQKLGFVGNGTANVRVEQILPVQGKANSKKKDQTAI